MELLTLGIDVSSVSLAASSHQTVIAAQIGVERFLKEIDSGATSIRSSENYFCVNQSSVSVSAVGIGLSASLKLVEDPVGIAVGVIGPGYFKNETDAPPSMDRIMDLIHNDQALELIPVGSRGIVHDLDTINSLHDVRLDPACSSAVPGGPGQTVLILCRGDVSVTGAHYLGTFVSYREI